MMMVKPFNGKAKIIAIQFGIGIDEAEGRFLLEKFKSKGLIAA